MGVACTCCAFSSLGLHLVNPTDCAVPPLWAGLHAALWWALLFTFVAQLERLAVDSAAGKANLVLCKTHFNTS